MLKLHNFNFNSCLLSSKAQLVTFVYSKMRTHMILSSLKTRFKEKSGKKYLESKLTDANTYSSKKKGISTIGCIVDVDAFPKKEVFNDLINEFSLRPNSVKIISFKRDYDEDSMFTTHVFSTKDLGWKGKIDNSYVREFMDREYDLLINYFNEENLLMKLLTAQTKARIKVGFGDIDLKVNDLILNTPLSDYQIFKSELKKYLKILNEI